MFNPETEAHNMLFLLRNLQRESMFISPIKDIDNLPYHESIISLGYIRAMRRNMISTVFQLEMVLKGIIN